MTDSNSKEDPRVESDQGIMPGEKGHKGDDPATEYNSHMSNDAKPGSHSALFGLTPQDKPSQNAGSGPGSGVIGTSGHAGKHNSDKGNAVTEAPADVKTGDTTTGSGADSKTDSAPAGAGTTMSTPSQGSGKVGE